MEYQDIIYEVTNDVAIIRLNRPKTLCAMTMSMGEELLHAVRQAERDARAIVIGSVGRAFCSGVDLADGYIDLTDPARDMGRNFDAIINPIVYQIRATSVPVVTAIRGAAAGVGCGIGLAADLIVAGQSAIFYQAFSKIGLSPDGGSSYLLTKAIGRPRALEMMLLGEKLIAAKALEWGLINRVVPDDDVDDAALAIATTLAQGPASLGIIKRVAWAALDASFETALSNERVAQREAGRTNDFVEGVAAFREKRVPRFSGQ